MFLKFLSDYEYPAAVWPAVFQFENMMQSILREDWRELTMLNEDELKANLKMRFEWFPESIKIDNTLTDEFLTRELSNVIALLRDLQVTNSTSEIDSLDPRFAINTLRLQKCVKSSEEFRLFLQTKKTPFNN